MCKTLSSKAIIFQLVNKFTFLQVSIIFLKKREWEVRQNTTVWLASLLRRRWLHVSAALLGHHQVTRATIEESIQCIDISCGKYFYDYQGDVIVVMFCVAMFVYSTIKVRLKSVCCSVGGYSGCLRRGWIWLRLWGASCDLMMAQQSGQNL